MECYPAAKTGGLGDVVGALPKYLNASGQSSAVVIPYYNNNWIRERSMEIEFAGQFDLDAERIGFQILKMEEDLPGFPLYFVHIPGKLNRPNPYGYHDDIRRYLSFQRAILDWILSFEDKPDIIHCHDHHSALIPFMLKCCHKYKPISRLPSVFTIHNAAYQGAMDWGNVRLIPTFDAGNLGLLDWNHAINPMASAIKCAWAVTTVSPSYMQSLFSQSHGLEWLLNNERDKCTGILNGIDTGTWDPSSDPMIRYHLKKDKHAFKRNNKRWLCEQLDLDPTKPLFVFIGRMAYEKGADFLPGAIGEFLSRWPENQFIILGSGSSSIEWQYKALEQHFHEKVRTFLEFNERLAHQLYASADFLLMPSRVEPCGLNQMYCMRYGGVPVVRAVGGLIDSVEPLENDSGNGYLFLELENHQLMYALDAAEQLFHDNNRMKQVRIRNMEKDFSWERSVNQYIDVYEFLQQP